MSLITSKQLTRTNTIRETGRTVIVILAIACYVNCWHENDHFPFRWKNRPLLDIAIVQRSTPVKADKARSRSRYQPLISFTYSFMHARTHALTCSPAAVSTFPLVPLPSSLLTLSCRSSNLSSLLSIISYIFFFFFLFSRLSSCRHLELLSWLLETMSRYDYSSIGNWQQAPFC